MASAQEERKNPEVGINKDRAVMDEVPPPDKVDEPQLGSKCMFVENNLSVYGPELLVSFEACDNKKWSKRTFGDARYQYDEACAKLQEFCDSILQVYYDSDE